MTGASARLAMSLALVVLTALFVGSVGGNHTTGHASFTTNCALGGCHDTANGGNFAYYNGADAAAVIDHAIAGNMTVTPAGGTGEVASYIGTVLPAPPSQPVPFNEGPGLGAGATFNLQYIFHSVQWGGGATSTAQSQGPSPTQGVVSFGVSGFNYTATYQPNACATGTDKFGYNATGAATTSTRTQDISINAASSAPTFTTTTLAAGETNVPYSQVVNVRCQSIATFSLVAGALPPGLNLASDGTISGTPNSGSVGTHNFTVQAVYAGATSTQPLSIVIAQGKPAITSATIAPHGAVNVVYPGYQILATNSPTTYNATGLPPGLVVAPGTGAITGTPSSAAGSPYTASISAANGAGREDHSALVRALERMAGHTVAANSEWE